MHLSVAVLAEERVVSSTSLPCGDCAQLQQLAMGKSNKGKGLRWAREVTC